MVIMETRHLTPTGWCMGTSGGYAMMVGQWMNEVEPPADRVETWTYDHDRKAWCRDWTAGECPLDARLELHRKYPRIPEELL